MTPALFDRLRRNDPAEASLDMIPYAAFMGMALRREGERISLIMRQDLKLVGAPGRLHGGAIGAALEFAGMAELLWRDHLAGRTAEPLARPISLTVDYMHGAQADADLQACARIMRHGARIALVHAEAWQKSPDSPVASGFMHFRLGDRERA